MTAKRPLILIVDDAAEDIATYKRHLKRGRSRPYKIREASTGAKALASCHRRSPDCVLLNFRLPDLNGLEVMQALADKSGVLPFAVVMLAEIGDAQIVVDAMKYGAHVLEKNWITPEMLEQVIANAIEKAASQREVEEQRRELAIKNLLLEQQLADLQRERDGDAIHVRYEAEKAFGESEARYRALVEASSQLVWTADANGISDKSWTWWSEVTGLPVAALVGGRWITTVHPGDRQALHAIWERSREKQAPFDVEFRLRARDGEYRHFSARGVPLFAGVEFNGWIGTLNDVTGRRRAEEALKLANERFTVAEAAANGYVYDRNPASNRVERSAGFGAVLGYDESESDWWGTLIHPDDIHRVKGMLNQVALGQGTDETDDYSLEYRIRHKDGRYLWVWDRGRLMRDETERVTRVIGSVVDISERKQIENSLRESESRLKLAVAAMNGGAWEWDLITNEVRWSDEMYELFDCRPSEFTPSVEGWLKSLSAEDRARAADAIEAIRRGEDAQMIYRAIGPDGGARWLELHGITLHDEQGRAVLLTGITIDVTERKLAEEALRESEARVHTLAANLPDGLIYQMRRGPDGSRHFLYVSENAERLRGVTAEEAMADVGALYNLIPEDYRARLIEAEDAALRDFTEFRCETPFLMPNGELRWSQQSSAPRRLSDGSVIWDGVEIDITERKRAEETLRESEEKFSKVFKASPSRIAIATQDDRRYIDVNDAVLFTTGYERSEMIGRSVDELQIFAWPGGQDRLLQELQNGPVRDLEVGLRSKSGEVRTVLMSAEVITLNGRQCVLTLSNDITERKQAEEELREKEKFIQSLIDAVPTGIYIYDLKERRNLFNNPRMASLLGYAPDDLTAMRADFLSLLLHPDDRRLAYAHFDGLREATDGSVLEFEYRLKHRDGQWRWFVSRELVFMRDADGRPLQILGVAQEITERKQVEETLRENEERLRIAMEAANAGSFDWDIASGVIVWTPPRPGSSQERDIEQDYQFWRAAVHPQDIDWVEADIAKSLAERRDLNIDYRVLRADGSVRWVSNIGHAFYNEAGQPARMKGLRIDHTDRKRVEELMRENEERLRLALEGAKAGVWEVKFDPYSAYWSKEYRDLFGFSEIDEATNEVWATRVHRGDLQRVVDGNNALLSADRNEMRQEFRIIHPEHGERWILDFVRVRRDRAGRPISLGGINFDVTDRKRAEEAMRESEERFRELVETISDVFWIMHPESQAPAYLSPACERLWGRPAAELNGNLDRWFDAIHQEDRERVKKKYLAKAGEGGYDEIYRVVRPDGSTVWVHDRGFPVCDETGAIRHIVGVAEDITDRKRVEDELRESQRRYEALAEAVPQLVWTAAADGGVDYFNRRWYAYTETTPDESLNQAWRSLIHPDDRERVEKLWKKSVRGGEHLHFEFRLRGADGAYRWFIGRGVPYRDERRDATPRKRDGENGAAGAGNGAAFDGGKGRIVKWFGTFTDIHDLKIAEEALRVSEEYARRQNAELETIYQATPVGLSLLDRDFRIMRINEMLAEIDGVTVDRAIGRTTRELTPGMADRLEPIFKRVIRTGRPIMNVEIHGETPREPGVERDWLASYYPVKAADGSVQGVGCVVMEITERKRAEEALRESEERLRQAAQAAGFGLYSVDLQTGENYWSPEMRRIFGLSDDDAVVLGNSLGLIHPDDREETMRVIRAALDPRGDGEFEHEFRAQLHDGNTRWTLARGKTLFAGNGRRRKPSRIIGVAFDITERKEDEERLHASERRLKLSLAAGHAGTWEWRIKEDKLIWSDEYYELYGMAPGDLEPTLENFILCVHPEDRDRIQTEIRELLQKRKDAELEFRFIRTGGDVRWAHSSAQLTLDESGEPEMMVGIMIDITERKQAEMEREELLRKEREARAQAEAANRGKDDFVAMISHELRSPLNAMLGWSKILKKGGVDAKTQSHAVEVIERSARAQQTLIEDLLDMARIVGGKLRLETRPVSLARVVEAAADVVRPAVVAREIDLRLPINSNNSNSADEVTGDPDRLQQVVWNLLSNAVKFTTRGGSVEVVLERVGALAQITVTDTGRGIKAEDLPFIFDRFRQADSSSSRRSAGLGLGLALVKHLVELHGGQVSADSPGEGKGSSFIVRLPVRAVRGEATPTRDLDRAGLRMEERDGRVSEREARGDFPAFPLDDVWALIVDDEADARELIATLLKQYGARVTVASCAAEAFDKLRKGEAGARPDVLVSDISMPDEDGYTLIERVRKLPPEEGGKIPAIALTALERPSDRIKALAAGFSMHVPKPVEPEELAMVIANLTGHPAGIIL